ncbi:uncharacterized protein I206_102966 [Kwoniella pini CBS 10737]|uniref:BTB domain-containing protein n=1 Tax=Kwoniella pini CBS 10737 TaxID=1296096 RepID=A0A1B9I745_9TREE|nr:uncharacterized protein I206_03318 [Kwoniella pini CBS 10737]OCF51251.1 hypothetical protein I206_03318 [Kwoniella pini CBS 10737]
MKNFKDETKDLVIISSNGVAMRVDSCLLKCNSAVFRSMFSTCDSDDNSIHLDHPSIPLILFLLVVNDQPLEIVQEDWEDFKAAVELCERYEAANIAIRMLNQVQPINKFGHERAYDLFILASKFNDIFTACRVINTCAYWQDASYEGTDKFWKKGGDRDLMKGLPVDWVWAYMKCHMNLAPRDLSREYWEDLSVKFMKYLCSVSTAL